ncbi:MAG: 4a-hydroxytetrahydrobiopterin dehydratase [Vicinamibacteria bacterium]
MTEKLDALAALPTRPGAPKLAGPAIDESFRTLAGWALADGALEKMFRFADWRATMAFVNAVSDVANEVDHHPDLELGWGRCTVRWSTHDAGGVTQNDLSCAARTELLARRSGAK